MICSRPGRYFTWAELTTTSTGLPNGPDDEAQANLVALCAAVLDPLRTVTAGPITVTSGYRSEAVNVAVKGSATSDHKRGRAADIKRAWHHDAAQLAKAILDLDGDFDQVIWYAPSRGGHVHVSYRIDGTNRREVLHAPAAGGYVPWTPS